MKAVYKTDMLVFDYSHHKRFLSYRRMQLKVSLNMYPCYAFKLPKPSRINLLHKVTYNYTYITLFVNFGEMGYSVDD